MSVVYRGERSTEDNDAVGISHRLYPVVGTRIVCDLPMTRNKCRIPGWVRFPRIAPKRSVGDGRPRWVLGIEPGTFFDFDPDSNTDDAQEYFELGIDGEGYEHWFNQVDWRIYVLEGDNIDRVEDIGSGGLGKWVRYVRDARGEWETVRYQDSGLTDWVTGNARGKAVIVDADRPVRHEGRAGGVSEPDAGDPCSGLR